MYRIRFSKNWIEKVEKWADDHAPMVKRYDALLHYREMQSLAQELTEWEMHQFCMCNAWPNKIIPEEEWPGDDIDSDDWPD